MDIQTTKLELIQFLLNTEKESLLLKLRDLILEENSEIIGSLADGQALTLEMLNAKLAKAEEDYKAGRVTKDEDLAEEIKSW